MDSAGAMTAPGGDDHPCDADEVGEPTARPGSAFGLRISGNHGATLADSPMDERGKCGHPATGHARSDQSTQN